MYLTDFRKRKKTMVINSFNYGSTNLIAGLKLTNVSLPGLSLSLSLFKHQNDTLRIFDFIAFLLAFFIIIFFIPWNNEKMLPLSVNSSRRWTFCKAMVKKFIWPIYICLCFILPFLDFYMSHAWIFILIQKAK